MRSHAAAFGQTDQARWVTHVEMCDAVLDLGDAYLDSARAWWSADGDGRPFEQVFQVLPRLFRHLTLSTVDRSVARIGPEQARALRAAIARGVARLEPFEITIGPAIPHTHAIELYVRPDPRLRELYETVADGYREAFPDLEPEPTAMPWRAHTEIGYGRADFDHETLSKALLRTAGPVHGYQVPVTHRIDEVLVVVEDTWSADGLSWQPGTAARLPLGAASRLPDVHSTNRQEGVS